MFPELISLLDSSSAATNELPKFYLITESQDADGSFLTHHFLSKYLKGGSKVVFLGLSQSFSHYSAVAQKLGVNLQAARTSGQLVFINGLGFSRPFMHGGIAGSACDEGVLYNCIQANSLQPLYELLEGHLHEAARSESDRRRTHLLIDDLTVLYSLGIDAKQISDFTQYCQVSLMKDQELAGDLVALVHCDCGQEEEEEIVLLSNRLQHACTCHLKVEGLPSGFCKDVHGQLTVIQKAIGQEPGMRRKLLQFKIMDKSVSFFAAGTSSAVL